MHMAKSRRVALALLLGSFLLCTKTQAQTGFEAFELRLQKLLELELVSVSKQSESLLNVAAIYLLTADAIHRRLIPNRIELNFLRLGGA